MIVNVIVTIITEYAWICLNEQGFEYVSGSKYGKNLSMTGFSMCELYTAFWICQNMPWQSSDYISGSKYGRVLNMQELQRV